MVATFTLASALAMMLAELGQRPISATEKEFVTATDNQLAINMAISFFCRKDYLK